MNYYQKLSKQLGSDISFSGTDHATILGRGYLLITVSVIYDHTLFIPGSYHQSFIEEPEVHILGVSSSSTDNQVAFIPERVECLRELSDVIYSNSGVPIVDSARFFVGDHPAQKFERGTQQGGNYKCGGCGIQSHMIGDFIHAARMRRRSLQVIQSLAINGNFGKLVGKLKPLHNLSVSELRQELSARGQFDVTKNKPDLMDDLTRCLKGVQRVPTLLIANPEMSLAQCHLASYEVLDCEPLHDIKGHLSNLFEELPYVVGPLLKKEVLDIISTTMHKDKINCTDLRCLALHCQAFLKTKQVEWKIRSLMASISEITHTIYRDDVDRCPKLVLRLYNLTWLHHELCRSLSQHQKNING